MCILHNHLVLTLKFNINTFMAGKEQNKGKDYMEKLFIIIPSIVLFAFLGVPVSFILIKIVGLDENYAILATLGLCIFLAYKYFGIDEPDSTSNIKNGNMKFKTHNTSSSNINDTPVKDKITKPENDTLNQNERNQSELNKYINKKHSKEEIGLFYERYVGYVFESKGWHVIYHGSKKGKEDEGIDLICIKEDRVRLVQCKYWSQNKTLFENSIFQLYGTWQLRVKNKEFGSKKVDAYMITSTTLGDVAKNSAETLDVKFTENFALNKSYPQIKCTTTKDGEKIYHLPTDQQYDNIGINKDSRRFYVSTVANAIAKGHRRAYRHAFRNNDL